MFSKLKRKICVYGEAHLFLENVQNEDMMGI